MILNKRLLIAVSIFLLLVCFSQAQESTEVVSLELSGEFRAVGPSQPVKLEGSATAVEVFFDLLPTSLRFILPSFPSMVTENGIVYSNFWAETYEPRIGGGSFEPLFDFQNRYARMWIEHHSDARIVVRVRGALCNTEGDIAHSDIPSGSPYGDGDWVDEWFYIYPDGIHTRHVKIYTGLAPVSRPFGFDRDPPRVVHEFMEAAVLGEDGHMPTDDIEVDALTLIRLIGGHTENRLTEGESKTISFKPYPKDFGDFRDANIMLVNLKSEYRPFTIGMPYGSRIQPYWPEDDLPHVFQTWGNPPDEGYSTAFGHIVNYWHYRRTNNTLEQVYLQGMTNSENPVKDIVSYAWSWIAPPLIQMEGLGLSYTVIKYDHAQRAYIVPRNDRGPRDFEFTLEEDEDIGEFGAPMWIINPTFIVKNWGTSGVELKVDGQSVEVGKNFRVGYEETHTGIDLILWLKMKSDKAIKFSLSPVNK
ncbi:MAG: hypothetical protein WBG58_00580 [Ignavibacteriaceae bacterium]